MPSNFILKNAKEKLKENIYYRLDIITGIDLTGSYRTDQTLSTLKVNFCEYSPEYQDIEKIKSLSINDRCKNSIGGKETITIDTVFLLEDITNQFFLKPGTVWLNGELVWEPTDALNICINQDQKSITNFKIEFAGQRIQTIKDSFYTNLIKLPGSIVNGNKVTVLIPVMEVIRYYFSGSRYFTAKLFNGGMESEKIKSAFIYKSDFNEEKQRVYIWLRRKCYDSDAILLARALADKNALDSMRSIYSTSIQSINAYERKVKKFPKKCCPRVSFPFSNGGELEVQGQWMPPNEKGEFTTYLVRTLEKCNHNLPFESLEIESVDSYNSSGKSSTKLKPFSIKSIRRGDVSHKPILSEGEQPNENIEPQELAFYAERFNHLSEIHISKVSKSSEKEQERYGKDEKLEPETDEASTQTGNYRKDNNIEPWEVVVREGEPIPINERLNVTSEAIKSIEERAKSFSITVLPINKLDGSMPYGFYDFKFPPGKTANYTWSYVGDRNRKALFLEITSNQSTIYLLEIEGKKSTGYSLYLLSQSTIKDFGHSAETFLQRIAEKSGNGIISGIFNKYFTVTSMKHTSSNDDSFTERLVRALKEAFNPSER